MHFGWVLTILCFEAMEEIVSMHRTNEEPETVEMNMKLGSVIDKMVQAIIVPVLFISL